MIGPPFPDRQRIARLEGVKAGRGGRAWLACRRRLAVLRWYKWVKKKGKEKIIYKTGICKKKLEKQ